MTDFITKQGNTRTALKATLTSVQGSVTLATVTGVEFIMCTTLFEKVIARPVDDAMNLPDVVVVFTEEELNNIGDFLGEFIVTYTDGKKERFPSDKYITIKILKNVGVV